MSLAALLSQKAGSKSANDDKERSLTIKANLSPNSKPTKIEELFNPEKLALNGNNGPKILSKEEQAKKQLHKEQAKKLKAAIAKAQKVAKMHMSGKVAEDGPKPVKKQNNKKDKSDIVLLTPEQEKEKNKRTLFIGNIPVNWSAQDLKRTAKAAVPFLIDSKENIVDKSVFKWNEDKTTLRYIAENKVYHRICKVNDLVVPNMEKILKKGEQSIKFDKNTMTENDDDEEDSDDEENENAKMKDAETAKKEEETLKKISELIEKCDTKSPVKSIEFERVSRIESQRFRSLPVMAEFVNKRKAAASLSAYADNAHSKNAYLVLHEDNCIKKLMTALIKNMDGSLADETHLLRVDRVVPDDSSNPAVVKKSKKDKKKKDGENDEENDENNDTTKHALTGEFSRKKSIFIGNLHFNETEDNLRQLFCEKFGPVEKVRIVRDKVSRMSKCFGFLQFVDRKCATLAIQFEKDYQKNWWKMQKKDKKPKKKSEEGDDEENDNSDNEENNDDNSNNNSGELKLNDRVLRIEKVLADDKRPTPHEDSKKVESLGKAAKKKPLASFSSRERRQLDRSKKWLRGEKKKKREKESGGKGKGKGKGGKGKGNGKGVRKE